jgi:hypothetical protein
MTSFFYVVSIAFHTSVPALRKCMHTSRKKNSFGSTAATRAPPAASLRRTWKTSWTSYPWTAFSDRVIQYGEDIFKRRHRTDVPLSQLTDSKLRTDGDAAASIDTVLRHASQTELQNDWWRWFVLFETPWGVFGTNPKKVLLHFG